MTGTGTFLEILNYQLRLEDATSVIPRKIRLNEIY